MSLKLSMDPARDTMPFRLARDAILPLLVERPLSNDTVSFILLYNV